MEVVEDVRAAHDEARVIAHARCRPAGDDGASHERVLRECRAELEASRRALLNAWEMPYTRVLKQVDEHKKLEKKARMKTACARSRLRRSSGRCGRRSWLRVASVGKAWPDDHYGRWRCVFSPDASECEKPPAVCARTLGMCDENDRVVVVGYGG